MLFRESKTPRRILICAVLIGTVCCSGSIVPAPVEARPQYKKAFEKLYRNGRKGKVTCEVCHAKGVKSKKSRNHYGEDLAKALGGKETDQQKIRDAMEKIEGKTCSSKTYIERLRAGYAPCPHGKSDKSRRPLSIIDRYLAAPEGE